ncbi:MAG: hypothetical protein ACRCWO_00625 [Bosea sp. (in: a-proteobacteria)]
MSVAALSLLAFAAVATPANAQVAVEDIRIQLFLERSGKLSDNIVGAKKNFHNTVIGEGDAGEPAESVLVTLLITGPKNAKSSDKIARDLASVTVTQQSKQGPKVLLRRAYGGFLFGEDGKAHKAFMLDNATCAPLEVDVKLGRSRKTAKVDFKCGE